MVRGGGYCNTYSVEKVYEKRCERQGLGRMTGDTVPFTHPSNVYTSYCRERTARCTLQEATLDMFIGMCSLAHWVVYPAERRRKPGDERLNGIQQGTLPPFPTTKAMLLVRHGNKKNPKKPLWTYFSISRLGEHGSPAKELVMPTTCYCTVPFVAAS